MPTFSLSGIKLSLPKLLLTESIRRMLEKGWYEVEERKALEAHLRSGDRVLELGGGAGFLAAFSAQFVGASQVTTVEANPKMLAVLQKNLADNDCSLVNVRHGVVLGKTTEKETSFHVPEAFWAASQDTSAMDSSWLSVSVPTLSFDALLGEEQPTVLVVDVEGSEASYFFLDLPECLRLIVIELHPQKYSPHAIRALFNRLDRQSFIFQPLGSHGTVVCFERL
ncbi:FkbM family methyltransferase [Shimia abyssi]|uniref:FkbM family methyltransferase n=1 Tax=Shimia abyssi TaxID=1662395 RepID=A0A2P8F779_9RHOB|nr:FkbM family methyltransferase [Shimia abyssi]PSL17579.1 FkbM family methyltransferase [Shimia abyssi]